MSVFDNLEDILESIRNMSDEELLNDLFPHREIEANVYLNIEDYTNKIIEFCKKTGRSADSEEILYHPDRYEGVCTEVELDYIIEYWLNKAEKDNTLIFPEDAHFETYQAEFVFNDVKMFAVRMYGQGCWQMIGINKTK